MRERIADGVWLEDGDVDARPASIAWVSDGYVEAAGINDNLLVIVGNEIKQVIDGSAEQDFTRSEDVLQLRDVPAELDEVT